MCGRYGFVPDKDFYNRFDIQNRETEVSADYNTAPGMRVPVIVSNSPKKIEMMKWGLIPFWAKDPRIGYSTINARSEGIENKPAYRRPFRQQRCLVPASGFFEWKRVVDLGKPRKIPYWISLADDGIFAMAGIYDIWKDAEGMEIKTFSIVTTRANELMSEIHDRMPVIVNQKDEDKWLNNKVFDIKILKRIMNPIDSRKMKSYRVAELVNSPKNNSPEIMKRIE